MRRDSRLSGVLHLLLHLTQQTEPMTSEVLARAMDTNPVVIRRLMAGLRERGYVTSQKGHGGGWTLSCDPSQITLRDIYEALDSPTLLAVGNRTEAPGCRVEAAVNARLSKSFDDAEELLLSRFEEVTLAMLNDDIRARAAGHGHGHGHHGFADAEAMAKKFDDPARDEWQRPEEVLRVMEFSPQMHVADIGAGTGYFAVRLARAVPGGEVTAVDVEPSMVEFVEQRARREGLANLRASLGTPSGSGLARDSLDRILVVHVWHHLPDVGAFARDLAGALKPGGRVFVVDFPADARRGPPPGMRVDPESVVAELEAAGLTATVVPAAIPEQYIVEARRAP